VGRDGLTCAEVEEFFDSIITERGKSSDCHNDVEAISNPVELVAPKAIKKAPAPKTTNKSTTSRDNNDSPRNGNNAVGNSLSKKGGVSTSANDVPVESVTTQEPEEKETINEAKKDASSTSPIVSQGSVGTMQTANLKRSETNPVDNDIDKSHAKNSTASVENRGDDNDDDDDKAVRDHKYFYLTIATGALLLGAGCLVMAMGLTGNTYNRRHYSKRR